MKYDQTMSLRWIAIALLTVVASSWPASSSADKLIGGRFDAKANRCVLDNRAPKRGETVMFRLRAVCRFDEKSGAWRKLPESQPGKGEIKIQSGPRGATGAGTVASLADFDGAEPPALLAFLWTENGAAHSQMLTCGPVLCNDIALKPVSTGQIAACVPGATSARAQFVPDFHRCLSAH